ncbi:MAG: iron-containing alcohol dehydrogenase [Actinomycetota bacterium]
MGLTFSFRTSSEILFGSPGTQRGPELAAGHGGRVFLVTGAGSLERSGALDAILDRLDDLGAEVTRFVVGSEPDVGLVDTGAARCREAACTAVLAVGGGSVIDTAKAVAAVAAVGGQAIDYVEDVGGGRSLPRRGLPLVAMPTTAGSGSEVTRNSVLRVPDRAVKRSMRSDHLLPRVAVVDPALSAGAPVPVAAAAGLDALTHLVEAYVTVGAQPVTDALAVPGMRMALAALRKLAAGAADTPSGEQMALASLYGGIALANAGLGAVHGLVAPLGGAFAVPHGAACACLLPHTLTANHRALRERMPGHPALVRYEEIAGIVNPGGTSIERAAESLEGLRIALGVAPLGAYGIAATAFPDILAGCRGGSMRGNPVVLTDGELAGILSAALAA